MNPNVYRRPSGPSTLQVRHRPRGPEFGGQPIAAPIAIDKATECHVTPSDVASRMRDYLGHPVGLLDPSAGTGALIAGAEADTITAVERNPSLCDGLAASFPDVVLVRGCFLEWRTDATFDSIIMNPPFRKALEHVKKAISLLAPGGALVALVPVTFKMGDELERLPADTFALARVHTKIVYITND